MGMILITARGSFTQRFESKQFSAMHGGHAQAIAEAINFLSGSFLSDAIKLDHELQGEGDHPEKGFGELK